MRAIQAIQRISEGAQVEGVPSFVIELNALAGPRGILWRDNSATLWQFPTVPWSRYLRPW
jgi:hypothetical protein